MISMSFGKVERNPDAAARRLMQRAHNQDGLPEIAIGLNFLMVAWLMWLPFVAPRWAWLSAWGLVLLVGPFIGFSPWLIKKFRRRYLVEQVGYVEFKPMGKKRLGIVFGLAFVIAVFAVIAVSKGPMPSASWLVAGIGVCGGALAAFAGRIPRFVIGGMIMALLGIAVGLSRVSLEAGQAILFGVMGLLSLCSGVVVLITFLRRKDEASEP